MPTTEKPSAEDLFAAAWTQHGMNGCVLFREWHFCPGRRWRVDFALMPNAEFVQPIAIELEGRGRHQTFAGFKADAEKYNALCALGWRLFRFPSHVVAKDAEGVVHELTDLICGVVPQDSVLRK
jgi:very-short-patch-repair endonuclease